MPQNAVWAGTPSIKGATDFQRMALLTFSLVGLQFTWGIEMTYCTPYLLELGLTKSKTSLVWIAGPLSGMIMAPMIGAIADKSKSRWGRRRPFMIGGSVVVAMCLLVLGWAREIVEFFWGTEASRGSATLFLAVLSIYALDFAINAVQWSCRSLIVDTLPVSKQQSGSAWAGRMVSVGHLIVYGAGTLDLHAILGTALGDTQLKKLIIIAAATLLFAVGVTSWAVTERVRISDGADARKGGPFAILKEIFRTILHMPRRIQAICWIQFWSWIGWFPFLFYSATWVGEVYFRYHPESVHSTDVVGEIGRIGSTALILFSMVTFVTSVGLPFVIMSPEDNNATLSHVPASLRPIADETQQGKPALITVWFWSHFIFAGAMILTPFVTSVRFASTLVAVSGVPATLASWAPHTFIGIEINRLGGASGPKGGLVRRNSNSVFELAETGYNTDEGSEDDGLSGIYLGILNIFTTIPQFIGSFISMVVFSIFEPGQSADAAKVAKDGPNGISVCLLIGGVCSLAAAFSTSKLQRMM